jgi:hypothetical protein
VEIFSTINIYLYPILILFFTHDQQGLGKMGNPSEKKTNVNESNVYFGTDSLKKYFDPDSQPPLPLVELPPHLNPYHQDGVRIYAKMMTMHPANNVKAMPGMRSRGRMSDTALT